MGRSCSPPGTAEGSELDRGLWVRLAGAGAVAVGEGRGGGADTRRGARPAGPPDQTRHKCAPKRLGFGTRQNQDAGARLAGVSWAACTGSAGEALEVPDPSL